MNFAENKNRTKKLRNILYELSSNLLDGFQDDRFDTLISEFIEIYSDGYRHMYSDLCDIVTEISEKPESFTLEYLTLNLSVFVDYSSSSEDTIPCANSISKLFDHVCLEVQRTNKHTAQEAIIQKQNEQINSMRGLIEHMSLVQSGISAEADSTKKNLDRLEKQMKRASSKLKRSQTDIIAVLSIFSAIVLTFSGRLSYISSALSSVNTAPFFKSVFFILVCGFVMFNTIIVLMYITGRMIDVNIFSHLDGEYGVKLSRYVHIFNLTVLILAVLDVTLWLILFYNFPNAFQTINSIANQPSLNATQNNFIQ